MVEVRKTAIACLLGNVKNGIVGADKKIRGIIYAQSRQVNYKCLTLVLFKGRIQYGLRVGNELIKLTYGFQEILG